MSNSPTKFVTTPLRMHVFGYYSKLEALKELLDFSNRSIQEAQEDFLKRIKSFPQEDEHSVELSLGFQDDYNSLKGEIPDLQYFGIFILSFGAFEKILFDICRDSRILASANLEIEDFNGKGIEKAKIILSKIGKAESCFSDHKWGRLMLFNNIRNHCVHSNGEISNEKATKLKSLTVGMDGFDILERGRSSRIRIRSEFCDNFISTAEQFIGDLCSKLNGEYRQQQNDKNQ